MKRIVFLHMSRALAVLGLLVGSAAAAGESQPPNLLVNGGFEADGGQTGERTPKGWTYWTRDSNSGDAVLDSTVSHGGSRSLRVEHRGALDWSVASKGMIAVSPGQILELRGWIKAEKLTRASLCVTSFDAKGKAIDWELAPAETSGTHDWREFSRSLVVPDGCADMQVRLIGNGTGVAWLDDVSLTLAGDVSALQAGLKDKHLTLENRWLSVRLDAASGAISVTDKRINRNWEQKKIDGGVVLTDANVRDNTLDLSLLSLGDNLHLKAALTLVPDRAEIQLSLEAQGPMTQRLAFPQPFVTEAGTWLVLPMNEGIMFPAADASVKPISLICYGGHGICMPWFGATAAAADGAGNGGAGVMTIIQSPDDADIDMTRQQGTGLFIRPRWEPTRGQFGYARKLTWVFTENGGYPAQARRYREYAQSTGLLKTLAQKQKENPNVDLLIGAANVWNWDMDPVALCREMKSLGMDRVLWSNGGKSAQLDAINAMGYLTSKYDIFQDVWPPGKPVWARHEGWPEDLVLLPDGSPMKGWAHVQHNADGSQTVFDGGVICSSRQLDVAKHRIPQELKTNAYRCRFIDTTTASPFRECYNPDHPLSRSEDRAYKMALLDYCSKDCGLVIGTETGIDPAVPYVDYFEGMMSLGPYRLPDAGRDTLKYKPPTPEFLKYQVGEYYRIPLWELVYHDCVVADWYWGDYNNKAPEVWNRRDLFNILYGTPPVFMFDKATWAANRQRFVKSYKDICPLVRKLGHEQMLSHEFVTADHAVQRTSWSDGTIIVVNFGEKPYSISANHPVEAMGFVVDHMP